MELKWLMIITGYYFFLIIIYVSFPQSIMGDAVINSSSVDDINTTFDPDEVGDIGFGVYDTIVRIFVFTTVGGSLPSNTPSWFQIPFSLWSILMSLITIFTIKNAIWKG